MKSWTERHEIKIEVDRIMATQSLKRCSLCGAINAKENTDCFVCCWHGEFDLDPASIREGIRELMDRCPELAPQTSHEEPIRIGRRQWFSLLIESLVEMFRPLNKVRQ